MKIFTIIRRIFGSSAGLTLDTGTETETDSLRVVTTLDTGTETETDAMQVSATLATGTETENMEISADGSAIFPQGTETETDSLSLVASLETGTETEIDAFTLTSTLATGTETETDSFRSSTLSVATGTETETDALTLSTSLNTGSESESFSVNAVADISQHTATATTVQTSGTDNWANPTNAQGAINGTESTISYAPVAQVNTDATLRCVLPAIGATPSGFTRGTIQIRVVHRWDLTITGAVEGVVDSFNTITLRDSAGALIVQLHRRTAATGGGTQAALITEDFTITPSEAQLTAGLEVWFNHSCLFTALNGNTSWSVDAAHLKTTYSKTGIV